MSDIYLWYDVIHSICHSQSEHPNKALLPQGFLGSGVTKLYFTKSLSGTGTIPDLESHPFSFSLACAFPLGPCIAAVLPQFPFPSHPLLFQSPMQPFTFLPSYPSASFPSPSLFHRRTRASYVYNVCLAWYNVVLTHGSTQA